MSIRRREMRGGNLGGTSAPPARAGRYAPSVDPVLTSAIRGLWLAYPELSARGPGPAWLLPVLSAILLVVVFGLFVDLPATLAAVGIALTVPFAGATLLRLVATAEAVVRPVRDRRRGRYGDRPGEILPSYTVLVPLYDEASVLPALVRSLSALDYPTDRLDIVIVLEARDSRTLAAAALVAFPAHMRLVVVPVGGPKTKPKALDYALAFAASDLVVVYDAEDRPEPDQLRIAAAVFAEAGPGLACAQARLNVYNASASFLTRQFALEYSALFDGLLPALERLGLPIPLGGTSNHFRLDLLRRVGAWDPYNVTEDADLGIRLARLGYETRIIASTTWEEAPVTRKVWLGQRTRWLKGWVQTWLVHMRHPARLWRDLGAWQFIGLQTLMSGIMLSVIVYPPFVALAVYAWSVGDLWLEPATATDRILHWASVATLVAGMAAPALTAVAAVARRGRLGLAPWVLLMPVYWLAIAVAGYRAVVDLLRRPFYWEKTRHGLGGLPSSRRRLPPPSKPRVAGRMRSSG